MPSRTDVYRFITHQNEEITWDHDVINMRTFDTQWAEVAAFVGPGIVNGWEVLPVTQVEIDALPVAEREALAHTDATMIFKVTAGDGLISHYAAYTPVDVYFALPIRQASIIYYVYARETDCLAERHVAEVFYTTDQYYDASHNAIYLGTVVTFYDESLNQTWIYQIRDDKRRRVLKDLEGAVMDVIRETFFSHVHLGGPDHPSKIQLGTQVVQNLVTVVGSTIFLIDPFRLPTDPTTVTPQSQALTEYAGADVLVNGVKLSASDHSLDNLGGKLYLKNSIAAGDIVQIVKKLYPKDTQIARGPQDDPPSLVSSIPPPAVTGDAALAIDPRYKLSAERVADVDAGTIVFDTLPLSRIGQIDHYGMNRVRERAVVEPAVAMRTRDQQTFYIVDPEAKVGYDTEIAYANQSYLAGRLLSTPLGLYKSADTAFSQLTLTAFDEDEGRVIKVLDNLVEGRHGGENRFNEVYALTDRGTVWISFNAGVNWTELVIPALDNIFVNDFTVSTDKVQREVNNNTTYDYYKVYHLATTLGIFDANFLAAKGNFLGGSDLIDIETIPWTPNATHVGEEFTGLLEIVTVHTTTTDLGTTTGYDRTLYAAKAGGGAYWLSGTSGYGLLVEGSETLGVTGMMWLFENNGIVLSTSTKAYITHSARNVVVQTAEVYENYWEHPFTHLGDTPHLSYDFTTAGRTTNKLSQELGRRTYMVGLDHGVAISSLDDHLHEVVPSQPGIGGRVTVVSNRSVGVLGGRLRVVAKKSLASLPCFLHVISVMEANANIGMTDADLERAAGWEPLSWEISGSDVLSGTRDIVASDNTQAALETSFGADQQVVTYYAATDYGVWQSEDGGSRWTRPSYYWDGKNVPLVTRDGVSVDPSEYGNSVNFANQSLTFTAQQSTNCKVRMEKDFWEYYAVNGGWEQTAADLVVYVDDGPTTIPYTIDQSSGKITFVQSLSATTNVTFSVVKTAAYITEVGVTPHSEVLDAFIPSDTVYTQLVADVEATDGSFKVLATTGFVGDVIQILIGGERITVQRLDDYTFRTINPRSGAFYPKGTIVYLVEIGRRLGIQDELSLADSGQTYHLNSVSDSNLLRTQLAIREVWDDIFEPDSGVPPYGSGYSEVVSGVLNEVIHRGSIDALDEAGSTSTLWNGLSVSPRNAPSAPRVISAMVDPGGPNFTVGTEKGVWRYDGTKWQQLTDLMGAAFVHYLETDRRGYLIAGTSAGLWVSPDGGTTWAPSVSFPQDQWGYLQGSVSWYSPSRNFEAYGKSDGMAFVIYNWVDGQPESFRSDHYDDLDGAKVYGFYEGVFITVDEQTGQQTKHDSLIVCSALGLWLLYTGARTSPRSALLKGREPLNPGTTGAKANDQRYIISGTDSKGDSIYEKLRFFGAFQDPRPKTVPLILMTNDGLRKTRNWRWANPIPSDEGDIYFAFEASPLSTTDPTKRFVCNCFTTGVDQTIEDTSVDAWKKYKCFVGTDRGVFRSYDGCTTVEPCERIPGATAVYTLEYVNGTLFAGSNSGLWMSSNDGDDWSRFGVEVGNVQYPRDAAVAQTFLPLNANVTKVDVYLHSKVE